MRNTFKVKEQDFRSASLMFRFWEAGCPGSGDCKEVVGIDHFPFCRNCGL